MKPTALHLALTCALAALASGCASGDAATPEQLAAACPQLTSSGALPAANTVLSSATLVPASSSAPQHCQVDGEINRRTGLDGKSYAIRFRLRMPVAGWNGRFFMSGGGGTNGTLVDPIARVAEGYAAIGTDSGHDNTANNDPNAGGTAAFGADPQARIDFGYNAYDQVTQVGKALVGRFYHQPPHHAYFVGCSEGGREGLLMSQRFPEHYDGVVAGDPVLHLPLGPLSGVYTTQLFAALAQRANLKLANGDPALNKTYSDTDLLLMRNAVLKACDAMDGLADGIVDNQPACTPARVAPALAEIQCSGAKTDACLSADQIATMQKAYLGTFNSRGQQLYSDWQWDAGMGGQNGSSYNPSWRSWWLGSYASATNNATKLNFATALAVAYSTPPRLPSPVSQSLAYALGYDFDTEPAKLYATSPPFNQSAAQLYFTDATDLSRFRARRAKLMVYHGASDSSVSVNDTLRWYQAMSAAMGGDARDFARFFVVPGMNHCSGGPATDSFDMLPQLVDWVERGTAPASVTARASNPGYFNVAARTRPLCPYPQQARYTGSGDINDAANFRCQ